MAVAEREARQYENERKLLRLQKAESLAVLAGGIAHNFNNLLTAILSNAELAERYPALAREAFTEIKSTGRRAANLCHQMLIYTGQTGHRMAVVDVGAIIDAAVLSMRATLKPGCEVAYNFQSEPRAVWVHWAELQQIVEGLLTNSVEAGATAIQIQTVGRQHTVPFEALGELLHPGDYIEVTLADNGKGMAAEVLARVFEPFFSTKFDGRGLGLPAAAGLIRTHKGNIEIESKPGAGTTVRIQLPLAQPSQTSCPESPN
jgi:signal transduction histidine kinase